MAKKTKSAKTSNSGATTATQADEAKNVTRGEDQGNDVFQQARLARGEDKDGATAAADDSKSNAGVAKSKQAAEANYTDEKKAADLAKDAREEYLKSVGADSNSSSVSGGKKVEMADHKGELFVGPVTCTSVHGETHEKISAKIELPTASGEEYLWYAFKQYHPHAIREKFVIDATNTDDPNLRTRFE